MVIVCKNDARGRIIVVRTGWDSYTTSSKRREIEKWGEEFEDELYSYCDRLHVDPYLIGVTVDDIMQNIGDPREEARKIIRRRLRKLRLI